MTATRILLLILSLVSSGRACIPTVTPDYIYDLEWQQEQERISTSSVLLTTVRESTPATTSPSSAAPTTTTTAQDTTTTTSPTTTSTTTSSTTSTSTSTTTTTTVPQICPTTPTPWRLNTVTGVCYYVTTNTGWGQDAEAACTGLGVPGDVHLASIGTQMENDFILSNVITDAAYYWLGLSQPTGATTFSGTGMWTDGSPYDYPNGYSNWDGAPPGMSGGPRCAAIYGQFVSVFDGKWTSFACTGSNLRSICEVMAT